MVEIYCSKNHYSVVEGDASFTAAIINEELQFDVVNKPYYTVGIDDFNRNSLRDICNNALEFYRTAERHSNISLVQFVDNSFEMLDLKDIPIVAHWIISTSENQIVNISFTAAHYILSLINNINKPDLTIDEIFDIDNDTLLAPLVGSNFYKIMSPRGYNVNNITISRSTQNLISVSTRWRR